MKVWVNGGSRGMGSEIAEIILKKYGEVTVLTSYPDIGSFSDRINVVDKGENLSSLYTNCQAAIKKYGEPDVVIHAAGGGLGIKDPLANFKDFNEVFYRNFSHIVEINHCLFQNRDNKRIIKIIHIGSIAASQAVGSVTYNVAKATLSSYVRSLGNDAAKKNAIVCGINIGAYFTNDNAMGRLESKNKKAFNEFLQKKIPWGKMIKTSDFYPFIDFLIENDIFYFSGAMIPMDSGQSLTYDGI